MGQTITSLSKGDAAPPDLTFDLRVRQAASGTPSPQSCLAFTPPLSPLPHFMLPPQINASVPVERVIAVAEAAGKAILEIYNSEVRTVCGQLSPPHGRG